MYQRGIKALGIRHVRCLLPNDAGTCNMRIRYLLHIPRRYGLHHHREMGRDSLHGAHETESAEACWI